MGGGVRRGPWRWLRAWLRNTLQRETRERELDEELDTYVTMLAEEELARGRAPAEARRHARIRGGGMEQVKEEVRAARAGAALDDLARDLRVGVRGLVREKAFTVTALVALALGIGATASVFSVVNGVLLSPLRYADPNDLVVVLHEGRNPVAPANYLDWRRSASEFLELNAAEYWSPNVSRADGAEKLVGLRVTPDMFAMLGVAPVLGRQFSGGSDGAGRTGEVILSDRLWRRNHGSDPDVIGTTLRLNGAPFTIVGVMPPDFEFAPFWATDAELWVPLSLADRAGSRGGNSLRVFGRLGRGVTVEMARTRLASITSALEASFPGTNRNVMITPLKERVVGGARTPLLILLGAVSFLLLIACANVAHMMLARASTRQREIVMRTALGASRSRIVRQLLTESLILGLAGGALGVLLSAWSIRVLRGLGGSGIPRMDAVTIDVRVLGFALIVSLATGIVFGIVPALQAARRDAAEVLRDSDRGSTHGRGRSRARDGLLVSEFALALILLTGAGLMVRSFVALQRVDPGLEPAGVLSMQLSVNGAASSSPGARLAFYEAVVDRVGALPGVEAASAINHLPLAGDLWGISFAIEGRPPAEPGERPGGVYRVVMPDYFETMGITVEQGRSIQASDGAGSLPVVVINRAMANRHWPGEDPIGQRITIGVAGPDAGWLTIVGVVEDVVRGDWAAPPEDEYYLPLAQTRSMLEEEGAHISYITLVARAADDAAAIAPAVRHAVHEIDPNVAISDVRTMKDVLAAAVAPSRFPLILMAVFAVVALILAMVGILGMTSYSLSKRTHEIGIRMALGARPLRVFGGLVGHGLIVAVVGVVLGLAGAFFLTRLMATMLFGVTATDPITFGAVSLMLALVGVSGSAIPAWRLLRTDPVSALRTD